MPDGCCDDNRQPIQNIFCFHERLKKQNQAQGGYPIEISWENEPESYFEFIEVTYLATEGRSAQILYQQGLDGVLASIDLYKLEEDDIVRLECIKDYFLRKKTGDSVFFTLEDDIIVANSFINTNTTCDGYIDNFIQSRQDLKHHANHFIDYLRDISDKCSDNDTDTNQDDNIDTNQDGDTGSNQDGDIDDINPMDKL